MSICTVKQLKEVLNRMDESYQLWFGSEEIIVTPEDTDEAMAYIKPNPGMFGYPDIDFEINIKYEKYFK